MQPDASPMTDLLQRLPLALLLAATVTARSTDIALSARPDHATIVAGEPLFVTVLVSNSSPQTISLRTDGDSFSRTFLGPDGK